jgi:hypothetical protein
MNNNKENTTTICIRRQHDKICILEKIIHYTGINIETINTLETVVSNLIDTIELKEEEKIFVCLNTLKKIINEQEILNIIVDLSISIAIQIPLVFTIEVNNKTKNYIKYINNNYILPFF